jgi:hypothetical protein
LSVTHAELATAPGHPFYKRLNELLDQKKFDEFAERECVSFYADNNGRPSLPPGTYFRLLLIGYFEGIDSERGIAWRAADSLALRQFLHIGLDESCDAILTGHLIGSDFTSILAHNTGRPAATRRAPASRRFLRSCLSSVVYVSTHGGQPSMQCVGPKKALRKKPVKSHCCLEALGQVNESCKVPGPLADM